MVGGPCYTSAGNFISAIQGGVDPRTGLFNITLPLVNIRANQLMGPEFSLVLFYSPLSSQNVGFGNGFRLNLSKYDTNNSELSLSTGEEYRVDNNGRIKQKKLKNFTFEKIDDGQYKIIYKSGSIEYLTMKSGAICVPSKIFSPTGRSLSLTWNSEFSPARLSQICTDDNRTICSISYPDGNLAATKFTLYPDESCVKRTMTFQFHNEYVVLFSCQLSDSDAIVGDTAAPLTWSFEYSEIGSSKNYKAITILTSPTGLVEQIRYHTDKEMEFPSVASLPPLPCVSEHVVFGGPKQPRMKTQWTYTQKNYLGNGAGFNSWQPSTDQMLNFLLRDYFYASTADHFDENDEVICTVRRRYNSYHLLISEERVRNGKVHIKSNEYYAIPGLSFDEQPTQYSLPRTQTESWSEVHQNSPPRIQITHLEFDEHGNLVRQQAPDGTVIEHTYYSASGENNDCPPDPYGFVRHLKAITVTPFKMDNNEVVRMERNTWKKLFLNCSNNTNNQYFLVKNTTNHMVGNRLTRVCLTYFTDCDDYQLYGRIKNRMITVIPNVNIDSDKFTNVENINYSIKNGRITEMVEFIGFDGVGISTTVTQHALTGTKLSETSSQGIETSYRYDHLNRIVEKTVCPKSKFERIVKWEYGCGEMGNFVIEIDSVGNKQKTIFNRVGHKIGQEFCDTETSSWFETHSCTYNELGEIQSAIVHDWLADEKLGNKNRCFTLQSTVSYDGWGGIESIAYSDGRTVYESTNKINLQRTEYTRSEQSSLMSGKSIISYDPRSLLPHSKERRNPMDDQISVYRYKWDCLGRLIEDIDENDATTRREYDECGRLVELTLSDGTVVNRTYAPHLDTERIATISVTLPSANSHQTSTQLLGTQRFDSIGRVIERTTGGRKMTFSYQNGSFKPHTVTLPSSKILQYSYNPAINDAICSINGENLTQIFDYDVQTGNLLSAKESYTEVQKVWKNDRSLVEEFFINNNDGKKRARYRTTLNGVVVDYTDILNKKIQSELDSCGRLMKVVDGNLEINITYDDFGRLHTQHTQDRLSNSSLNTTLLYDSFGNEIRRTIFVNITKYTVELEQKWAKNGLVSMRTTKQNDTTIREERFSYDCRNRLIRFDVTGSHLPSESYGHQMTGQTYTYDALNNLTSVETDLCDGTSDHAIFMYENEVDPCQLTKISHTHNDFPGLVRLQYDSDGRMTHDEAGRHLYYDILGRLTAIDGNEIGNVTYEYDALNRLISQNIPDDSCQLYYRGNELVSEIMSSSQQSNRLIKIGHNYCAIERTDNLILNDGDTNNCPLLSVNTVEKSNELYAWSPYGSASNSHNLLLGYNGERIDPITGVYHLGNGYRAFNTTLMRFTCPDNLSPFGGGGINAYVYCGGDPINYTDPSGHLSWQAILGIVFGVVGIGATVVTAGLAISAAGGLAAALSETSVTTLFFKGLGVVSNATAIISSGLEDTHPDISAELGLVSLLTSATALLKSSPQRIKSVLKIPKPLRGILIQYKQAKEQIREARFLIKMFQIGQFAGKHSSIQNKHFSNIKPFEYLEHDVNYAKMTIGSMQRNIPLNKRFQTTANDFDELNTELEKTPDMLAIASRTTGEMNDVASVYHSCYNELTSLLHTI